MLTTIDNPYSPFDDFTAWLAYDNEKDYNTCGRIARIAKIDNDMSQAEINKEHDRAMDVIIQNDFMNIYKKVWSEDDDNYSDVDSNS